MKRALIALLTATAIASPSMADDNSVYVGGSLNWLLKNRMNYGVAGNLGHASTFKKTDIDYSLFVGVDFGRTSLELEYLNQGHATDALFVRNNKFVNAISGTNAGLTNIGGDAGSSSIMANAWVNVYDKNKMHFAVGGGVGRTKTSLDDYSTSAGTFMDTSDWSNSYQFMAKIGYDLSDDMTASLGYRWHKTAAADFMSTAGENFSANSKNRSVMARLTYKFGAKSTKAKPVVAPAPKPEPKPVLAKVKSKPVEAKPLVKPVVKKPALPATKEFIVFFDFDKSDVSATATAILKKAKSEFDKYKFIKISTVGHTDASGSNTYNNRLALKRVRAVQAKLVALGVAADKINMDAKGELQLLVKTADGVKEAQNRRVEITLTR